MQHVYVIRMEEWNAGMLASGSERILGVKAETTHFNSKKHLSFNLVQDKLTHHSTIPIGSKPLSFAFARPHTMLYSFFFTGLIVVSKQ
jgi:hypothetical protein